MLGKEIVSNPVMQKIRVMPSSVAILLDLDGTITEIRGKPSEVIVPDSVKKSLKKISSNYDLLAVISGRTASNAKDLVRLKKLIYVGNHGLEIIWPDGKYEVEAGALLFSKEIPAIVRSMKKVFDSIDGIVIENKELSLSIHYRMTKDPQEARGILLRELKKRALKIPMRLREGRKVIDLRPDVDVNKGTIALKLIANSGVKNALFVGDDLTDMDAFIALRSMGEANSLSIAVRSTEVDKEVLKAADLIVDGVDEVKELLRYLADA